MNPSQWLQAVLSRPRFAWIRRHALPSLVCLGAMAYFASKLSAKEPSLLESQDFGIACELFRTFHLSPDHSPLHFVFMNLWSRLDDTSVAFVRLPSVVFCGLAAVVVFSTARRIGGQVAGVVAAAALATNPMVVDNARSMRLYAWVLLLSALCCWYAQAYVAIPRPRRALFGLALCSTLAVYTSLFLWLLVGSVALVVTVNAGIVRRDRTELKRLGVVALVVSVLVVPQIIHIFVAIAFTEDRHARYAGLSSSPLRFLIEIGKDLFFGEDAPRRLPASLLLVPLLAAGLGLPAVGRRGTQVAGLLLVPSLVVAWVLSRSSPVMARYLNYLLPVFAVLTGVSAVRGARRIVTLPVVGALLVLSVFSSANAYAVAPTDWPAASAYIESIRRPDDVVAVFPAYWSWTLRRVAPLRDFVPFTAPAELDRILARGRRVILLRNNGRDFASEKALLGAKTRFRRVFVTHLRDPLEVYEVRPQRVRPLDLRADSAPSILIAGIVGSGGYPWQHDRATSDPFGRLRALFGSSHLAVVGYAPYYPSWTARRLLGGAQSESLLPNQTVLDALKSAGVSVLVMAAPDQQPSATQAVVGRSGLCVISGESDHQEPAIWLLADVRVGILSFGADAWTSTRETSSSAAEWARAKCDIVAARHALGPNGRLLVFLGQEPAYSRLPSAREERRAHEAIDLGADAVVGMGGFSVQEVEQYRDGLIAYSLGTLLRPPAAPLSARESTGIALRLTFPAERKIGFAVYPVTFDDQYRPALGALHADDALVRTDGNDRQVSLVDRLRTAVVTYDTPSGRTARISDWHTKEAALPAIPQGWAGRLLEPTLEWLFSRRRADLVHDASGGFVGPSTELVDAVLVAFGESRRVVQFTPPTRGSVSATFVGMPLGRSLEIIYGVGDDRIRSVYRAPRPQRLRVFIAGGTVLDTRVAYVAGWKRTPVKGLEDVTGERPVTVTLTAPGEHFAVGVDLVAAAEPAPLR